MLSDLIGEVPEVQPVSNISTAADLLKQGAGEFSILPSLPEEVKLLSMYIQYFTEVEFIILTSYCNFVQKKQLG